MKVYDKNRGKYRKKIGKFKICEFCNPKNIRDQECKNLSGENWMVFVNKYPYMDGNIMIIPKRHIENIEDLNDEEWKEFKKIVEYAKKKLTKIFNTKSFNIGLNIGKESGASIEHMHWQLIPRRYAPQNGTNIFTDLYVITTHPKDLKKMLDK